MPVVFIYLSVCLLLSVFVPAARCCAHRQALSRWVHCIGRRYCFPRFCPKFPKNRCSVGGKVILCAGLLSLTLDCVGVCLGMVLIGMDSEGLVQVSFHCVGRLR